MGKRNCKKVVMKMKNSLRGDLCGAGRETLLGNRFACP